MLLEQALHQMQTGQKAGEVLQMLHHTGFLGEGLLNQCTPFVLKGLYDLF